MNSRPNASTVTPSEVNCKHGRAESPEATSGLQPRISLPSPFKARGVHEEANPGWSRQIDDLNPGSPVPRAAVRKAGSSRVFRVPARDVFPATPTFENARKQLKEESLGSEYSQCPSQIHLPHRCWRQVHRSSRVPTAALTPAFTFKNSSISRSAKMLPASSRKTRPTRNGPRHGFQSTPEQRARIKCPATSTRLGVK